MKKKTRNKLFMADTKHKKKIEFPTIALIMGVSCVATALLAYGLYTLLPNVNKTWQIVSFWFQIIVFAIIAVVCFFVFLKLMLDWIEEIKDYCEDKKKE